MHDGAPPPETKAVKELSKKIILMCCSGCQLPRLEPHRKRLESAQKCNYKETVVEHQRSDLRPEEALGDLGRLFFQQPGHIHAQKD